MVGKKVDFLIQNKYMDNFNDYFYKNFNYHLENLLVGICYSNEFEVNDVKFHFYRDLDIVRIGFSDCRLPRITNKVYHEFVPPKPKYRIVGNELIPSSCFNTINVNIKTVEKRIYYENHPLIYTTDIPYYEVNVGPRSVATKIDSVVYNDVLTRTVTEWSHKKSYIVRKVKLKQLKLEIDLMVSKMFSEMGNYYEKNSKFISENKILELL